MRLHRATLVLALAVTAVASAVPADDDHDRALRLREDRLVLPLEDLLQRLDLGPDARILELESEYEHGRHVYEIEYVDGGGRVREVYIDAATGEILEHED